MCLNWSLFRLRPFVKFLLLWSWQRDVVRVVIISQIGRLISGVVNAIFIISWSYVVIAVTVSSCIPGVIISYWATLHVEKIIPCRSLLTTTSTKTKSINFLLMKNAQLDTLNLSKKMFNKSISKLIYCFQYIQYPAFTMNWNTFPCVKQLRQYECTQSIVNTAQG